MNYYCFIVSLMVFLPISHSVQDQTRVIVDYKDGNDTMCRSTSNICKTLDVALSVVENNATIVTVKILDGIYHHNATAYSTLTRSGITITGNGRNVTTIKCSNGTGFGFINASSIHISALTITGCGELRDSTTLNARAISDATLQFRAALYFLNVINVIIDRIAVINSNGMGVAMYDVTGTVNFNHSIFRNNSVSSDEIYVYPGGGGFSVEFTFCEPGVLTMLNTSECEASTNNDSVYLFYKCRFQSNNATTVYATDTTYATDTYGFSNQQFGRGGGLSVFFKGKAFNNSVTIDNCRFIGNHAVWGGGFHSDIARNNKLTIINSTFNSNRCPIKEYLSTGTGGGAIRIAFFAMQASVQYNSITIKQCNFSKNFAYYGGAVSFIIAKEADRIAASNAVNFVECIWCDNKAQTGSAVNLETQPFPLGVTPYVTFSNCSFFNNTNEYTKRLKKPVGIGALYSDNVPVIFSGNCTFSSNKGTAVIGSATFVILATNSVTRFDMNTGNNGGAIALLENTYLIFNNHTTLWFTNNKAYSKGGAIYFVSSSEKDFISTRKCFVFYNNTSAEQGKWNISVYFHNNTDLYNKSIYATTLLPCAREPLPNNITCPGPSSLKFLFNETFHFNNSTGTIANNSMTDAIRIDVNNCKKLRVPPGRLLNLKITSFDELCNKVKPVFFVQTLNPNISAVDNTTKYIYNNKIRLYGKQGTQNVKVKLESVDSRPWSIIIKVNLTKCPLGFSYNMYTCECDEKDYYGIDKCYNNNISANLDPYIWGGMVQNKTKNLTFVTADCPQGYCNVTSSSLTLPSPKDNAEFELQECLYRNETLCGKCITGYCVATNSPIYKCINSTSSQYGIIWLIVLKYIPFTICLLLIVFFNINLVDGPLNSYILFTQIIDSVGPVSNAVIHLKKKDIKATKLFAKMYYFLYGPWNSNYFEMLVSDFCAYKFHSTIKVLMFEYIPALYPLVLFIVFYSIIPCITNCLIISRADMPRRCLLRAKRIFIIFRRTWSIKSSIIHGLTTFLVLSYAKVTTVTGLLLSSTALYGHQQKEGIVKTVVRLDGTMDFLGQEHLPFACVAFILSFTVILLPPLLLLSYPLLPVIINKLHLQDKWFFKTLIIRPLDKCVPFFDAFQSCFKNKYRCFAGLYFLYRVITAAILTFQWKMTTRLIYQQGFFLIITLIHCVCQPY